LRKFQNEPISVYLLIAADAQLSLQDTDNMRAFAIIEELSGSAGTSLGDIAVAAEDDHYWIDANAVVELSGRKDDQIWIEKFWNMLKKVETYGYSDLASKRVKAHVETV
jgi:hypothetical protein